MNNYAYIGNDSVSANFLSLIINNKKPQYIITGQDRIEGRGKKITPSPLVEIAKQNKIPVLKTNNPNSEKFIKKIKEFGNIDYFLVFSFGYILSNDFLKIPNRMSVNIHPSLLPKYRGAAPINRVIINGEKKTGVSFYKMIKKMDAGPLIYQEEYVLKPNITSLQLKENLINLAYVMFLDFDWNKNFDLIEQKENMVSFAPKIIKEELFYSSTLNANELNNKINGLSEYGIKAKINNKYVKIRKSNINENHSQKEAGKLEIKNKSLILYCNQGSIIIEEIQPEGKKNMHVKSFINGYSIKNGDKICAVYSE